MRKFKEGDDYWGLWQQPNGKWTLSLSVWDAISEEIAETHDAKSFTSKKAGLDYCSKFGIEDVYIQDYRDLYKQAINNDLETASHSIWDDKTCITKSTAIKIAIGSALVAIFCTAIIALGIHALVNY